MFLAGTIAPTGLARVRHEHHGTHHAVGQRLGVAVGVVGLRALEARAVGLIVDEWDRAVVTAERGSGQREAPGCVVEGFANRFTPAFGISGVVDLVEDHQRAVVLRANPVPGGVTCHLRIGDDDSVIFRGVLCVRVAESRVQGQPEGGGRLSPLDLEVFGGHHDGDLVDRTVGQQLGSNPQGKPSFP